MAGVSALAIKIAVAREFGIPVREMISADRKHRFAHPRQVAMALCRDLLGFSYPRIGRCFGGRDHTTCIFAERRVAERCQASVEYAQQVAAIWLSLTTDGAAIAAGCPFPQPIQPVTQTHDVAPSPPPAASWQLGQRSPYPPPACSAPVLSSDPRKGRQGQASKPAATGNGAWPTLQSGRYAA